MQHLISIAICEAVCVKLIKLGNSPGQWASTVLMYSVAWFEGCRTLLRECQIKAQCFSHTLGFTIQPNTVYTYQQALTTQKKT